MTGSPRRHPLSGRAAEAHRCDLVIADFYRVVGERLSRKGDIDEDSSSPGRNTPAHMMENPADFYYGVLWNKLYRRELVEQIEETAARYGMGKEPDKTGKNGKTGKDSMPEESGRVRVFSIQWLSRNRKIVNGQPDLIVIDEAHHALAETYRELWKSYPEARKLGMTATPCRLNRKGFTDLFDTLITSWSIAEFIGRGWLSSFDYVSIRANSREQRLVDSLKKRGADGDYQVKEMNAVLNRETGIRQLYESVRRYAAGKKGIVYAVSIAHARQIAAYYSLHGVESVAIDSRTPLWNARNW